MDNQLEPNISSSIENLSNTNIETEIPIDFPQTLSGEALIPFHSRFKSWIRAVALMVVLIFVQEQISWAFNYDSRVLWSPNQVEFTTKHEINPVAPQQDLSLATPETVSAHIADSLKNLLTQIAGKPNTRIQLGLTGGHTLLVD